MRDGKGIPTLLSGMGGFVCALPTATFAVALPHLRALGTMEDWQLSCAAGGVMFGQLAAAVFAGALADAFGRRRTIMAGAVAYLLSFLAFPLSCGRFVPFAAGRLLQGLATGLITAVLPVMLAETLPSERRGGGIGVFQLFFTVGLAAGAVIGFFAPDMPHWSIPLVIPLPVVAVFAACLALARESERPVRAAVPGGRRLFPLAWRLPEERRALASAVCVAAMTAATGIGAVLLYSADMLVRAGAEPAAAHGWDFAVKAVNLLATIVAVLLIDRVGRKPLMAWGLAGTILSLAGIAAAWALRGCAAADGYAAFPVIAILLVLFAGSYAIGPGCCVTVLVTEILPGRIRAKGTSFAMLCNHLTGLTIVSSFLPLSGVSGFGGVFAGLAAISFAYLAFVLRALPETCGKEL